MALESPRYFSNDMGGWYTDLVYTGVYLYILQGHPSRSPQDHLSILPVYTGTGMSVYWYTLVYTRGTRPARLAVTPKS